MATPSNYRTRYRPAARTALIRRPPAAPMGIYGMRCVRMRKEPALPTLRERNRDGWCPICASSVVLSFMIFFAFRRILAGAELFQYRGTARRSSSAAQLCVAAHYSAFWKAIGNTLFYSRPPDSGHGRAFLFAVLMQSGSLGRWQRFSSPCCLCRRSNR